MCPALQRYWETAPLPGVVSDPTASLPPGATTTPRNPGEDSERGGGTGGAGSCMPGTADINDIGNGSGTRSSPTDGGAI